MWFKPRHKHPRALPGLSPQCGARSSPHTAQGLRNMQTLIPGYDTNCDAGMTLCFHLAGGRGRFGGHTWLCSGVTSGECSGDQSASGIKPRASPARRPVPSGVPVLFLQGGFDHPWRAPSEQSVYPSGWARSRGGRLTQGSLTEWSLCPGTDEDSSLWAFWSSEKHKASGRASAKAEVRKTKAFYTGTALV